MARFPGLTVLERAIDAYSYPFVAFDFENDCELKFPTIRVLDRHIQTNLLAGDPGRLKDALSSILYWGFYRMGIRAVRVERFRSKVTAEQIGCAAAILPNLSGPGIQELRKLRLQIPALKARFKEDKTSIPVTAENEQAYSWWVSTCQAYCGFVSPSPKTGGCRKRFLPPGRYRADRRRKLDPQHGGRDLNAWRCMHQSSIMMHMRTTLNLDDDLIREARKYTGIEEKTALIHEALRHLIAREAGKRLAALGGTMPDFKLPRRRRSSVRSGG